MKRETKNSKKGGGKYLKKNLKKDVSKCVCAFLNSGEKGTLYVGVNDSGKNSNKNVAFLFFTRSGLHASSPSLKARTGHYIVYWYLQTNEHWNEKKKRAFPTSKCMMFVMYFDTKIITVFCYKDQFVIINF